MRHRPWLYPAIVLLGALASCSTIDNLSKSLQETGLRYDRLETRYDEIAAIVDTVKQGGKEALAIAKQADANADGKLTLNELLIALGAAVGGAGTWIAKRNMASNERKSLTEAEVAKLKESVAWVESKVDKPSA